MSFLEGIDPNLLRDPTIASISQSKKSLPPQTWKAEENFMKSQTERESVKQHKFVPKLPQSRRQSHLQDEVSLGEKATGIATSQSRKSSKSRDPPQGEGQFYTRRSSKLNYSAAKS